MYVIINTRGGSNGKLSQVYTYSLTKFISEYNPIFTRRTQISQVDGGLSISLCKVTIDGFENVFSEDDIKTMQSTGVLNYYPKGNYYRYYDGTYSKNIKTDTDTKYPLFSKKVYDKWGIPRPIKGGNSND